jgi:allophanate hydrolase subunit 2
VRVVALAGSALHEDSGRRHVASGVPTSGAFDRFAHAAATSLVGGGPEEASLEVVGRLDLTSPMDLLVAVTGPADGAVDGRPIPAWTAVGVPAGARLAVRAPARGYLAVAGGFTPAPVLGSRSTCLLGPIGPPPVRAGDWLPTGPGHAAACSPGDFCRAPDQVGPVRVVPGPHLGLAATRVQVVESSRIGVRLRPATPAPSGRGAAPGPPSTTLPSLGVLPGAIQALPSGEWVVLGPDAGTMGGYPIVGVVVSADLDRWAHALPGDEFDLLPLPADAAPGPAAPTVVRVSGLPG